MVNAAVLFAVLLRLASPVEPTLHVAVAANFHQCAQQLADIYQQQHQQPVTLYNGASGVLAMQMMHGAPYDVLMSADLARAQSLVAARVGEPDTLQMYALGEPVIWAPQGLPDTSVWETTRFVIANPAVAPYGQAGQQILAKLHNLTVPVRVNSVAHVYQVLYSGNVSMGVVAKSQVLSLPESQWFQPPQSWYTPIEQFMVSKRHAVSQQWYNLVLSPAGQSVIAACGYGRVDERR